jgi:hypothetical protein
VIHLSPAQAPGAKSGPAEKRKLIDRLYFSMIEIGDSYRNMESAADMAAAADKNAAKGLGKGR